MTATPTFVRLYTVDEVATLLQCTPQTVEIAARHGRLPGVQYGRPWLFPEDALAAALRLEAMANLKAAALPPASAPSQQPEAYSVTLPQSKRKAANHSSRTRPRPDLKPLTG